MRIYAYIAGIVITLLVAVGCYRLPEHFREQGRAEVRQQLADETRRMTQDRKAEIERIKKDHEEANARTIASYENQLSILDARYRAARSSGLRIASSGSQTYSGTTEAESTSGNNEAESTRLPANVAERLFDLARKADEVNAQLGACQKWIKEQGFTTD